MCIIAFIHVFKSQWINQFKTGNTHGTKLKLSKRLFRAPIPSSYYNTIST